MKSASAKRLSPRLQQLLQFDRSLQRRHNLRSGLIAGVDEVGRGPLAGPVVACALILHETSLDVPIDDSKRLSPPAREAAYREIVPNASIGIGFATPEEIDRIGIHNSSLLAMLRAVNRLPILPALILVDGPWVPPGCPVKTVPIIGGDAKSLSIASASIVAKVIRDRMMVWLHRILPEFGFHRHKGYGTPEHLKVLGQIGSTDFHRFSFRPVRAVIPRIRGIIPLKGGIDTKCRPRGSEGLDFDPPVKPEDDITIEYHRGRG